MIAKSKDEIWMLEAFRQAEKAYSQDEVPVGCVVVYNDIVIGKGHNLVESLSDSTAHAEMISITSAANYLDDWRLVDCSLYVTKEPCLMCFGAILNARVKNLYYGVSDSKNGFKIKTKDENYCIDHMQKIRSGILEIKCKNILVDFFKNKRKKNKI